MFDTVLEFSKEVSLVSEAKLSGYLQKAGFECPNLIFRSLIYGMWLTLSSAK